MNARESAATSSPGDTIRRVTRDWLGHKPEPEHLGRLQRAVNGAVDELESEIERLREQVNSGRTGRESAEGLPEGTLPRV